MSTKVQCVNCGHLTDANQPCGSCWCPDPESPDYTLARLVGHRLKDAGPRSIEIKLSIAWAKKMVAQDNARLDFIRMIAGLRTTTNDPPDSTGTLNHT